MSCQSIWFHTDLPEKVIDILCEDLEKKSAEGAHTSQLSDGVIDLKIRNSQTTWVGTHHWTAGFIWHYVQRANRENFGYDLTSIDNEMMQYTVYGVGQYYNWHRDTLITQLYQPGTPANSNYSTAEGFQRDALNLEMQQVRKLSFVLQLSDSSDYRGGNLQIMDEAGKSYIVPRKRGTMILFDSRSMHRVLKVKEGVRRSLVGWVVGPRWK